MRWGKGGRVGAWVVGRAPTGREKVLRSWDAQGASSGPRAQSVHRVIEQVTPSMANPGEPELLDVLVLSLSLRHWGGVPVPGLSPGLLQDDKTQTGQKHRNSLRFPHTLAPKPLGQVANHSQPLIFLEF